MIGAPIGWVHFLVSGRVSGTIKAVSFALLTLVAFVIAQIGQHQFAVSFAEDQLAGQLWYFGWIATLIDLTGFIAAIAGLVLAKRQC